MKIERSAVRMRSRKVFRISLVRELGSFLITRADRTLMPRGATGGTGSGDAKSAPPPSLAKDAVQVVHDRTLEPNEAVVPLPPGFRLTRFPRGGRLVVRVLAWVEGHAILVLGSEVRRPAVGDAVVDDHEFPMIDVQCTDLHGVSDLAAESVELGVPRLDNLPVVEFRIDDDNAGLRESLAHLRDVRRVTGEARIFLHHLLLAGSERVAEIGFLYIQEYTDGCACACFRLEDARDLLADRVVEKDKNADVDGSRRGVEILEKHGEESISVHEVFDEVQAQRIAYLRRRALPRVAGTEIGREHVCTPAT